MVCRRTAPLAHDDAIALHAANAFNAVSGKNKRCTINVSECCCPAVANANAFAVARNIDSSTIYFFNNTAIFAASAAKHVFEQQCSSARYVF